MQPHIEQRADEIAQQHNAAIAERQQSTIAALTDALRKARAERAALRDQLAELASVQDGYGWHATRQGLRKDVRRALRGHHSGNDNLEYALDLLGRVVTGWEGGFTLDMDTLADIRSFLKSVEG